MSALSTTHWFPIGPAPTNSQRSGGTCSGRVEVAAAHPTLADVVYIGGSNGGVWKTGVWSGNPPDWLSLSDDQRSLQCGGYHSMVVHPANPNMVLALVSGTGAGVLKSTNGGLGWTLIGNNEFEGAQLSGLAVDPANTNILYVSAWRYGPGGGVYKSTDGGLNWTNTTSFHDGPISDVIVAKFNSQILYAGMVSDSIAGVPTAGVYRSTDAGNTWKLMPDMVFSLFMGGTARLESATSTGVVYVTLFSQDLNGGTSVLRFKTTDSGDQWTQLSPSPGLLQPPPSGLSPELRSWHVLLAVDPKDSNRVFVNDAYSLFESTDGGKTWARCENLGDDWVNMAFDAGGQAIVTSDQGIHRFNYQDTNQNTAWAVKNGNLQLEQFYDVTVDPENPNLAYGIAQDLAPMKFTGSILWNSMEKGGGETGRVLVDPNNSNQLYISNPLAPPNSFVTRSTDGGQTWKIIFVNNGFASSDYNLAYAVQKSFVMDPSNSSRLLLATNRVFETKNAAANQPTWAPISNVLSPSQDVSGQYITALTIAKSNGQVIYAGTSDGHVWATGDGGANWKQRDTGLFSANSGPVWDWHINPLNPNQVFAVTTGGVWRMDSSLIWTQINGDLPTNIGFSTIFVDWRYAIPALWVGTWRSVYQSVDGGQSWKVFAADMPNTSVSDLEFLAAQNILAAGTSGRGMWEILIPPSKISGIVFEDPDGDGVYATTDKGIPGVVLFLDVNGNGKLDAFEFSTTSDSEGRFVFESVPPGTYTLYQQVPGGFVQTSKPFKSITVSGSNLENQNLGNRRLAIKVSHLIVNTIADVVLQPGRRPGQPIGAPDEAKR